LPLICRQICRRSESTITKLKSCRRSAADLSLAADLLADLRAACRRSEPTITKSKLADLPPLPIWTKLKLAADLPPICRRR
jgi:hypothetical protein